MTAAGAQELKPWTGGGTPALVLEDLDGRSHRLESYRGKVVLINFWATWCEPCREEMPSIDRLLRSMDGRPFAVLATVGIAKNAVVKLANDPRKLLGYLPDPFTDFFYGRSLDFKRDYRGFAVGCVDRLDSGCIQFLGEAKV